MNIAEQFKNASFFKVAKREVKRMLKSKIVLFTLLIAPIASLLTFAWLFSAGVVTNLPVTIVDEDHSALSRKVAQMLDAAPVARIESYQTSLVEAKARMDKGLTDAIIVLPPNMEKEVFKGQSPSLSVFINNTNLMKGGSLKSGIYKTISTLSAGIKVQTYMKSGLSQKQAISQAMPIHIDSHLLFNQYGNYAYFLALGLLPLMLNVFVFLGSTYALGIELKEKTAGHVMALANNNIVVAVVGKLIPYTLMFLFHSLLMNYLFFNVIGIPLKGSIGIIVFSEVVQVVVYQLLAALIIGLTSNLRLSLSIGSAYTMMALSFAGLTFPTIGMPKIAELFSYVFPYTFWIKIFISQTLRAQPIATIVVPMLIFVVFLMGALPAFPLLKKRYSNSVNWGKV